MKSSIMLIGASALLACAKPINKRYVETQWVQAVVTVTVTAGDEPTAAVFFEQPEPTVQQPEPTVHEQPQNDQPKPSIVVITTQQPTPPEPTVPAVQPEPTTEEAQPEPTTAKAEAPVADFSGDIPLTDYKQAMLDHHNVHRANHSADALTWDATLAGYAETIAKGCVFKHDMSQGGGGYGQNLASWGSSGDMSGLQIKSGAAGVTDQWYNSEMPNWTTYGADNPDSSLDLDAFGHFTQVVWKGSTTVGCATVQCPKDTVLQGFPSWYTVCNYHPAGNFGGQYGDNVLKPLNKKVVTV